MNPLTVNRKTIAVSDAAIEDLHNRIDHARWPEQETVSDWTQGVPLNYLKELAHDWRHNYDWRECETWINTTQLWETKIGDQSIAFFHIQSAESGAQPLLLTHGWPGSILEFTDLIPLLTNGPSQAFHLVIPCLPGYGFSSKPSTQGTGIVAIAALWDTLMKGLGYSEYFAHGGDWGSVITQTLPLIPNSGARGIHVTLPIVQPPEEYLAEPTPEEIDAMNAGTHYARWDNGYSQQQASRPQTLGYGLNDSAIGQLAWIAEKFWSWTDCEKDGIALPENAVRRQALLDTVSLYWFTETATSSARLYWESFHPTEALPQIDCPTGMSIFPKEIFKASRRWVESRFTDLRYWSTPSQGGHFAAMEQPEILAGEIRSCIATFK